MYHLITQLFCVGATIWNFSIFCISMVLSGFCCPNSLPLWIHMMKHQHCTAHFTLSCVDIHTGPKRHPDRFGLKNLFLSSFKYRFVKGKIGSSKHYIGHSITGLIWWTINSAQPISPPVLCWCQDVLTFLSSISPWCKQDFCSPNILLVQIL